MGLPERPPSLTMFTVCPKCALTLVVTAADLRVAQGYVRCGRCSSVFNALAQLSDERGARSTEAPPPEPGPEAAEPASSAAAPPPPAPPPPAAVPKPAPAPVEERVPDDALEFNPERTDAASVFVTAPPNPEWTAATGSFKELVAANQEAVAAEPKPPAASEEVDIELDAALLSGIIEGEGRKPSAPAPAQSTPHEPPAREPPPKAPGAQRPAGLKPAVAAAAAAAMRGVRSPEPVPAPPAQHRPAPPPVAPPPAAEPPAFELQPDDEPAPFAPAGDSRPRRDRLPWAAGAILLLLLFVAQLINHQRDALATDPRLSGPLTALYSSLGVPLMPHWDLRAYDVRQLGATVAPAPAPGGIGTITVRASIRNGGPRPQPLPLLRVTLQDRFGNRLASRDVQPGDYLPRGMAPGALMSVDQRIDAELAFVDPGSSAVGFELDACLPLRSGVACANDASGAR